jgi:hypothetical protein
MGAVQCTTPIGNQVIRKNRPTAPGARGYFAPENRAETAFQSMALKKDAI